MKRRTFLTSVVVTAGTLTAAQFADFTFNIASATEAASIFPQSVASGDPKPRSVILWARVVDSNQSDRQLTVRIKVSEDREFTKLVVDTDVFANTSNDGCLRLKITRLQPRTTYYYRFEYSQGNTLFQSRIGRTRTAPDLGDSNPVSFAYASCQDFIGKFYNGYLPLLTEENLAKIDFLVHLGDFVYETTGDSQFQDPNGARTIQFRDEQGAIALGEGDDAFFAANSLDNYRQLYQSYRSDAVLQVILENYPLIATWDDHEFSNDCFKANATFFSDQKSERDVIRKRNAEIAWLEYMPIDDAPRKQGGQTIDILDTSNNKLFPNTQIYRDFQFGRHLKLVLTDYRTRRPDHLIDEGEFPGKVFTTERRLRQSLGDSQFEQIFKDDSSNLLFSRFIPVVAWNELTSRQQNNLVDEFTQEYLDAGIEPDLSSSQRQTVAREKATEVLNGQLDANFLNDRLPFGQRIDTTGLPLGVAISNVNKLSLFSALGSRYAADQVFFDLFASLDINKSDRKQDAYGVEQEEFIKQSLMRTNATWKVVGSSVSNTAMVLDFTPENLENVPSQFPNLSQLANLLKRTSLAKRYLISVDQWDGFPKKREQLLEFYRQQGNVVLIAGDIHSSWITDHSSPSGNLFEFTGTSISSSSFGGLLSTLLSPSSTTQNARSFRELMQTLETEHGIDIRATSPLDALINELIDALDLFLVTQTPTSPFQASLNNLKIEDVNTNRNGVVVVDVSGNEYKTTYYLLEPTEVPKQFYTPNNPESVQQAINTYFALPEGRREQGGLRETRVYRVQDGGNDGIQFSGSVNTIDRQKPNRRQRLDDVPGNIIPEDWLDYL